MRLIDHARDNGFKKDVPHFDIDKLTDFIWSAGLWDRDRQGTFVRPPYDHFTVEFSLRASLSEEDLEETPEGSKPPCASLHNIKGEPAVYEYSVLAEMKKVTGSPFEFVICTSIKKGDMWYADQPVYEIKFDPHFRNFGPPRMKLLPSWALPHTKKIVEVCEENNGFDLGGVVVYYLMSFLTLLHTKDVEVVTESPTLKQIRKRKTKRIPKTTRVLKLGGAIKEYAKEVESQCEGNKLIQPVYRRGHMSTTRHKRYRVPNYWTRGHLMKPDLPPPMLADTEVKHEDFENSI